MFSSAFTPLPVSLHKNGFLEKQSAKAVENLGSSTNLVADYTGCLSEHRCEKGHSV